MLRLHLLGNATIQDDNSNLSGRAVQPRRLALLALLALAPRRALTRDKLLAYLWPESDTEQGRHLLSVAVYELRKAIGDTAIITARDEVALSTDLQVDVDAFDAAIVAGDYERAVDLYAGPLLDGFHINDAPEFERWADGERSHYARRFAEALEKLAIEKSAQGEAEASVAVWRRLAAHDPYSARVCCGLMHALEEAGDRAGALQQARMHGALLHEEFGAEPDPEVEALATRLRRQPREVALRHAAPGARAAANAERTALQPRRQLLGSALTLLVIGAIVTAFYLWRSRDIDVMASKASAIPTIAVLAFDNLSPGDTTGYFAEGLSEEILNALRRVPGMRVAARTSAFVFRGDVDLRDVGNQLGVDYVLEGTARMAGTRLKVTASLIGAHDGLTVWSDEYERALEMANLISIQEEIAQAVVRALSEQLGQSASGERLIAASTNDVQAFELFVTGRHFYHRRTVPDLRRALGYFDQAIARDPNYALAHASRAEVFALLGAYDYGALPPRTAFTAARASALRALEINPNLAEAHNALAAVLFNYDWDFVAAEQAFRRAIQLSPGYATAHQWYSLLLHCTGRPKEAFDEVMHARELDPLSSVIRTALARHYYLERNIERAIAEYSRTLASDSQFVPARFGLGLSYAEAGRYDEAIREYEAAGRIIGMRTPLQHALAANALGRAGRHTQAGSHLAQLAAAAATQYVPAEYFALSHIGMGDRDAAFAALEDAVANRSAGVAYIPIEPLVDPLRSDPRLADILAKIRPATR